MKKFFGEFKKFITRGNVLDMAVGVIVGGASTAIVNGLSNFVLKPIINYIISLILGKDSLSEIYTFLGEKAYKVEDGVEVLDLENCFYIDWGSLINAVINFLLIAFVLFIIVKVINNLREDNNEIKAKRKEAKADIKAMRAQGIKLTDKEAVDAYFAAKEARLAEEKAAAEEKARLEKLDNPTTEELLKEIRDLLKNK